MSEPGDAGWFAVQVSKTRFEPRHVTVFRHDSALGRIFAREADGTVRVGVTLHANRAGARQECIAKLRGRRQAFLDQARRAGQPRRSDNEVSQIDQVMSELELDAQSE